MKTIALTGATGYVGRFVAEELFRHDVTIRALARPQSNREGFSRSPEWIEGDLLSSNAVAELVNGVDAVVHMAYLHAPGRYRGGEGDDLETWLNVNLHGSLNLLHAAQKASVQRFIFLSSRAVFSHTQQGRVLDESHPTSPCTHYGAYKVAVEAFLQSFAHVGGMQTCAVRATGVYGKTYPVENSKWWNLIQAVLNDEPITSNRGGTEVHGADVAQVIYALLTQPVMPVNTIHLSDLYVTHRQIVELARRFAGKTGPLPPEPDTPPTNVLVSRHLETLGIRLGGIPALESTIKTLVDVART